MNFDIFNGVMMPFWGTLLGAGCVFAFRYGKISDLQKIFAGFAAGVMFAASVWSLIIPAMEYAENLQKMSFVPVLIGFWAGILFLWGLDRLVLKLYAFSDRDVLSHKNFMLAIAVMLHNIPEGMAVGVALACATNGMGEVTLAGALALSFGIAVQNLPEGAVISIPLAASGMSKIKSFFYGTISGAVEPVAAFFTMRILSKALLLMPYVLAFAAGAMIYVAVDELIPEAVNNKNSKSGVFFFAIGFSVMMVLDVAFG